jgi:CubicO group peptidase (beta-lactamase class C family)
MENTFFELSREQAGRDLVSSHGNPGTDPSRGPKGRRILPKVLRPLSYEGSIGVNSTAEDLAKFGQLLLRWTVHPAAPGGDGASLSPAGLWKLILAPVSRSTKTASFGHGPMLFDTKLASSRFHAGGHVCYGHTGTGYGSRSILYVCPELDWGFAGLFNTRDVNREEFFRLVAELLADAGLVRPRAVENSAVREWLSAVRSFHDATTIAPAPRPAKLDETLIPDALRPYVGTYESGVVGDIEVSVSVNGKLMIRGVEVDPEGPDHFRYPESASASDLNEPVRFVRAYPNGPVVQLIQAHVLFAPKKVPGV